MKDDRVYLQHILDEMMYLESLRSSVTYEDLTHDKTTEHAVTRALEIIGEA
ncbi:MAG: HepT-like ribonuclease domain-containing protein [Methanoregula sp.]